MKTWLILSLISFSLAVLAQSLETTEWSAPESCGATLKTFNNLATDDQSCSSIRDQDFSEQTFSMVFSKDQAFVTSFYGSDLQGTIFTKANLMGANFERANLQAVEFSEADVRETNFSHANLTEASFAAASVTIIV